ncbi:MAG: Gfo/Idh/MocA family oxidoreductase [Candidatus Aminicenantales bacterium]
MGAGMIAQGFDEPNDDQVLSMAHAITRTDGFMLGGFYDCDPRRAELAENKWNCPATPRNRAKWLENGWDVIYIATPDANHATDLRDAMARRPRAILIEKPLAVNNEEALDLLYEAVRFGVLVMVNYPRRWHSATARAARAIQAGHIGTPISAIFVFSGGVIHNAPHAFDLFHTWWGGGWRVALNSRHDDLTCLTFSREANSFTVAIIDRLTQPYYVWEAHIYCSHGKVELSHSPEFLELSRLQPHPVYSSYQVLTTLWRSEMDDEPLLCRAGEALAAALANPAQAEAASRRELECQIFMAETLRHF